MRLQAYLRIVSHEETLRLIQRETNISNMTLQQPKSPHGGIGDNQWWSLETARVDLDLNDEDRGVKALLMQCMPVLPALKKHQRAETEVFLEIVGYFKDRDRPRGVYFSAETIALLSELGGQLDFDTVPDHRS